MICPDCGWSSPDSDYRIRADGSIVKVITKSKKHIYYPIILEKIFDRNGRISWREIHKCPNCFFEFEQLIFN